MPRGVRSRQVCNMNAAVEPPVMDSRRPLCCIIRGKDSLSEDHYCLALNDRFGIAAAIVVIPFRVGNAARND